MINRPVQYVEYGSPIEIISAYHRWSFETENWKAIHQISNL